VVQCVDVGRSKSVSGETTLAGRAPPRLNPVRAEWSVWIASLLLCAVAVAVCVDWVDRPVARAMEWGSTEPPLAPLLGYVPALVVVAAVVFLPGIPLLALRWPRLARQVAVCAAAYVVAALAKHLGKIAFGRTWVESWQPYQPSFLRTGVYGFFPFHVGRGYGAFPSGHMCVTMALVVVAMVLWPRLWGLWAAGAVAMALLLVALNVHFVSDVVAGAWLGTACATLVLHAVRRWWPGWLAA
jgi:membrane-associated phospholipid phosphatase